MQRGRPMVPLTVADEDRQVLSRWIARPKTSQALALRARIVLRCAEGLPNFQVAQELKVGQDMVGKWRARFLKSGPAGLLGRVVLDARGGGPSRPVRASRSEDRSA